VTFIVREEATMPAKRSAVGMGDVTTATGIFTACDTAEVGCPVSGASAVVPGFTLDTSLAR
jgi:hypothetical protein